MLAIRQTSPEAATWSSAGSWAALATAGAFSIGLAAIFGLGALDYLSLDQLRQHRSELMAFVTAMPVTAVILFIAVYAAATALSIPGSILTLAGGFLFGAWLGAAAVLVGATAGATALFLAARGLFASVLRASAGPWLARMEAGVKDDTLTYLMVLRLMPAVPFAVVTLVPALLGVPLRSFVVATFFGIIPGTIAFASIGAGLGGIIDTAGPVSLQNVLTPATVIGLTGLAALALVPVVYKAIWRRAL